MGRQKQRPARAGEPQELKRKSLVRCQSPLQLLREMNMRARIIVMAAAVDCRGKFDHWPRRRNDFNPMVELLAAKKPVFGLYAPSNRRFGGGGPGGPGGAARPATPPADAPPPKTPAQLAKEAVEFANSDFIFDGSMEGNFDARRRAVPGADERHDRRRHPAQVAAAAPAASPWSSKMNEIAGNREGRREHRQAAELGVTGIMFVSVESADEVKAGIDAMRFKSKGGTRSEDVGSAPAFWGMSEKEYKEKADLWPLNPNGELVNWTIVESKAGLDEGARDRRGQGHRRAVARRRHAARPVLDAAARRHAQARRSGVGSVDSEGAGGVQGIQRRVRLPRHAERHRDAHEAGLQRVRDELGRSGIQGDRDRQESRGQIRLDGAFEVVQCVSA